jgi:hypothetical protein
MQHRLMNSEPCSCPWETRQVICVPRANGYLFKGLIVEKRRHLQCMRGVKPVLRMSSKIELRTGDDIYTFANMPSARIPVPNSSAVNNALDTCIYGSGCSRCENSASLPHPCQLPGATNMNFKRRRRALAIWLQIAAKRASLTTF